MWTDISPHFAIKTFIGNLQNRGGNIFFLYYFGLGGLLSQDVILVFLINPNWIMAFQNDGYSAIKCFYFLFNGNNVQLFKKPLRVCVKIYTDGPPYKCLSVKSCVIFSTKKSLGDKVGYVIRNIFFLIQLYQLKKKTVFKGTFLHYFLYLCFTLQKN